MFNSTVPLIRYIFIPTVFITILFFTKTALSQDVIECLGCNDTEFLLKAQAYGAQNQQANGASVILIDSPSGRFREYNINIQQGGGLGIDEFGGFDTTVIATQIPLLSNQTFVEQNLADIYFYGEKLRFALESIFVIDVPADVGYRSATDALRFPADAAAAMQTVASQDNSIANWLVKINQAADGIEFSGSISRTRSKKLKDSQIEASAKFKSKPIQVTFRYPDGTTQRYEVTGTVGTGGVLGELTFKATKIAFFADGSRIPTDPFQAAGAGEREYGSDQGNVAAIGAYLNSITGVDANVSNGILGGGSCIVTWTCALIDRGSETITRCTAECAN
ncbi:hypothetical protein KJ365_01045 [Glaciecola sp. XM2]|uniref:hypothetical protein n=1 Tax=Glaciecola sp. XM2 TaxID=1914931 RepID=UPI001BDF2290|nr:hypothetical protein [Glaciecola sp. XM2]MBT1449452.1 hypothetical protein [Glaciecola sp. XM2]